jgi:hypothetical protein
MSVQRTVWGNPQHIYARKHESRLDVCVRLIEEEIDNLELSAPSGVLNRMARLARELQEVEDSL